MNIEPKIGRRPGANFYFCSILFLCLFYFGFHVFLFYFYFSNFISILKCPAGQNSPLIGNLSKVDWARPKIEIK